MATTYKYRYNTGTHVPNWNEWTPDVSTACSGTVFQQQKDDPSGICPTQYQQNTGNKLVTWTPSTSNYCDGTVFYQTNTCDGSSRQATGVSVPNWSAWTPDPSGTRSGSVFQQQRTDLNGYCGAQYKYATGTCVAQFTVDDLGYFTGIPHPYFDVNPQYGITIMSNQWFNVGMVWANGANRLDFESFNTGVERLSACSFKVHGFETTKGYSNATPWYGAAGSLVSYEERLFDFDFSVTQTSIIGDGVGGVVNNGGIITGYSYHVGPIRAIPGCC